MKIQKKHKFKHIDQKYLYNQPRKYAKTSRTIQYKTERKHTNRPPIFLLFTFFAHFLFKSFNKCHVSIFMSDSETRNTLISNLLEMDVKADEREKKERQKGGSRSEG